MNKTDTTAPDVRTVSVFRNGRNKAVRLPKDVEIEGVTEYTVQRIGDSIVLTAARPTWMSLANTPKAPADFLSERPQVFNDEERF